MQLESRSMRETIMSFTNKSLSKEIMKRSKLRNKFSKDRKEKTEKRMTHSITIVFHFYEKPKRLSRRKKRKREQNILDSYKTFSF